MHNLNHLQFTYTKNTAGHYENIEITKKALGPIDPAHLCLITQLLWSLMHLTNYSIVAISSHVLFVLSVEGGDQQCCYGDNGDLLTDANGGGSVSRFSATRQPFRYMLHDFWPKMMCSQFADNAPAYHKLRPTDDCSAFVAPKRGTYKTNMMVIVYPFTFHSVIYMY